MAKYATINGIEITMSITRSRGRYEITWAGVKVYTDNSRLYDDFDTDPECAETAYDMLASKAAEIYCGAMATTNGDPYEVETEEQAMGLASLASRGDERMTEDDTYSEEWSDMCAKLDLDTCQPEAIHVLGGRYDTKAIVALYNDIH
jgi:hypothetical protein